MTTAKAHKNPLKASVVSVSKDLRTVKVKIPRIVPNAVYGKRLHLNTFVHADVRLGLNLTVGAVVEIAPSRKVSKTKAWKVISVKEAHAV